MAIFQMKSIPINSSFSTYCSKEKKIVKHTKVTKLQTIIFYYIPQVYTFYV